MECIHFELRELENAKAKVNWLIKSNYGFGHMNNSKVLVDDVTTAKGRFRSEALQLPRMGYKFYDTSVLYVFNCFTIHGIVEFLEETNFEIIRSPLSLMNVKLDVWTHPRNLIKDNSAMNIFQLET